MAEGPDRLGAEALSQERQTAVDALWFNPEERAEFVMTAIREGAETLEWDMSLYDMVCFSAQYLGRVTLQELAEDQELREIVIKLNQWLYNRHYFYTQDILGDPDRKAQDDDRERKPEGTEPSTGVRDTPNGGVRGDSSGKDGDGVAGLHDDK